MKTTPIPVKFDRQGHSCNFYGGFGPTHCNSVRAQKRATQLTTRCNEQVRQKRCVMCGRSVCVRVGVNVCRSIRLCACLRWCEASLRCKSLRWCARTHGCVWCAASLSHACLCESFAGASKTCCWTQVARRLQLCCDAPCRLYLHRITSTVISELARGQCRPSTGPR